MASLSSIALELREHIFEYVILGNIAEPPPLEPLSRLIADRGELKDINLRSHTKERDIYYPNKTQVPAVAPLLLINHQMHAEVKSILGRLEGLDDYEVDIVIVGDAELHPTWICLPRLTDRVESVKATFRIVGSSTDGFVGLGCGHPYSGFRSGEGTGPAFGWVVYALLERFLRVGPVGTRSDANLDQDSDISIQTLEIDVQAPSAIAVGSFRRPYQGLFESQPDDGTVFDPGFLVRFINKGLETLLAMTSNTSSYGGILYERVGEINVSLHGKLVKGWDLGEELRSLAFTDSFGGDEGEFIDWSFFAVEQREEKDLTLYLDC